MPVRSVDGRTIGSGARGPVVHRLQQLYQQHVAERRGGAMTVRVAMWSGPRNISTAMMRSWENRPDTEVVDEPFYAAYLQQTGIDHPGRDEVIASQPTDPEEVVRRLRAEETAPVHYAKHMTHHILRDWPLDWVGDFRNVLLIRDPEEVVASYVRSRESCEPDDIGLLQQVRLLDALPDDPPVIDAGDFLRDPETYLRWLCEWLGIEFTDRMLSWPAGPQGVRRGVGAVLVRHGGALHRVRAVAPAAGRARRARRRRRPGLPPRVRRPARAPAGPLSAAGFPG